MMQYQDGVWGKRLEVVGGCPRIATVWHIGYAHYVVPAARRVP